MLINRPPTGNVYLGFRTIDGLFEANVVTAHDQLPHEPEVDRLGQLQSIDFGHTGNIGQSFAFSRIGESLIATVGANDDAIEGQRRLQLPDRAAVPAETSVTRKTGIEIPPAGAYGLE